jgi:hypothetical protein
MATQSNTVVRGEDLKSSKPQRNSSSRNKSGMAMAANFATSSSATRRATGPRTPREKSGASSTHASTVFFRRPSSCRTNRAEYDALLNGLIENLQPQGKLEIVLVENLATLLWRKRRLLQVETAEIEKAQFLIWDLVLQNKIDELEYAQLKDSECNRNSCHKSSRFYSRRISGYRCDSANTEIDLWIQG